MISAVIFSRDRAAQLDLLLRSLKLNAPWVSNATVIYRATSHVYESTYDICRHEHPTVAFVPETMFRDTVIAAVSRGRTFTLLLCDDDVVYRSLPHLVTSPNDTLAINPQRLCVSLRLGANTTHCYPLGRSQRVPPSLARGSLATFKWRAQDCDFGYPGSLDGHVFRTEQLLTLIQAGEPTWQSPNELETHLNLACQSSLLPLMSCYHQSLLVGVPVNSVQTVYSPNRHSGEHHAPLATLNLRYFHGARLDLASIDAAKVNGAHCEFKLTWEKQKVPA